MPIDTPLLAAGAGVASFLIGRLLLHAPSEGTAAPAPAATAVDPNDQQNAGIEFPGTLQGIDQGLGTDPTGNISPNPPVTPPYPLPAPTPTPTPTATVYPIPGLKPPAGAVCVLRATALTRLFTVSGGVATAHTGYNNLKFTAYGGVSAHYKPNATLRRILTGSHAGYYVHPGDAGLTVTTF